MPIDSKEALQRLRDGNLRFVEQRPEGRTHWDRATATEARPFAAVLSCSDGRAPAEYIFDVGLGDLFVIRVAGNIVAPSQVGSIEFAVDAFGVPLVVVMGHTRCGAIAAAARHLQKGEAPPTDDVLRITSRIRPIIEPVLATPGLADPLRAAMRANVLASVAQLHGRKLIQDLVQAGRLRVVGAEYELESGRVLFLDEAAK